MDYFTDVYLKRVNKHGTNLQDRIHGRMECDFENKLNKSVNKVKMYDFERQNREIGLGILETKKINETEVVDYLLTRKTDDYANGFTFCTNNPSSEQKQVWMVLYKEQYETIGYNRYVVILLDDKIEWIGDDGLIHSSFVRYIGSKESKIKQSFKISYDVTVATPSKLLSMICPMNRFLKRDNKINISDETWRISGYDKISVSGVMYVTLEEDYTQKTEYADQHEIGGWTLTSVQGDDLVFTIGENKGIDFYCAYNGVLVDETIELSCNGNEKLKIIRTGFNSYKFDGTPGTYTVVARLAKNRLVTKTFSLTLSEKEENWLAIVGPSQLKVLQTLEYKLNTSLDSYTVNIESQNGCFAIEKIDGDKVYLKGINIGQDYILIIYNGVTYSTPINIISPWM